MKEYALQAVLDEDVRKLLESLDQLDLIESQKIFCSQCVNQITINNLQLIIPLKTDQFEYVCNNSVCVEQYYYNKEAR